MTNWDNSRSSQTYNFWTNSLKKKNQHLNRSEDFSTQPACRLIVAAEAWTNNLLLIWFSWTDRLSTIFSYSPLSNLLWQNQDQVGQSWNKSPDLYIYHLHLIYIQNEHWKSSEIKTKTLVENAYLYIAIHWTWCTEIDPHATLIRSLGLIGHYSIEVSERNLPLKI